MADLVVIGSSRRTFLIDIKARVTSTGEIRVTSTGEMRVI